MLRASIRVLWPRLVGRSRQPQQGGFWSSPFPRGAGSLLLPRAPLPRPLPLVALASLGSVVSGAPRGGPVRSLRSLAHPPLGAPSLVFRLAHRFAVARFAGFPPLAASRGLPCAPCPRLPVGYRPFAGAHAARAPLYLTPSGAPPP